MVVDISPPKKTSDSKFDDNLSLEMDPHELATLAESLLQGIDADLASRSEWESTRAKGIELLGLKMEQPRGDI